MRMTTGALSLLFVKGCVHLFPVVPALLGQADVAAHLFEEFHAAQFSLQIVDGAAEGGLGNAQPGGSDGIMFYIS